MRDQPRDLSCSDGVKNGSETDVDCGGACKACNPAAKCATDADCGSDVCKNGLCQAPSCTDGVKNGNETGVDCGGSCFKPEVCNGIDDDCNGLVDDGLGSTTCGVGACQVTVQNCVGGQAQTCTPLPAQVEVCDGLLDDDCDGVVDNGCACIDGKTQSCYTAAPGTLGVGLCQSGTQTCAHGQWGACAGEVTPTAEACDGLDNDCNGQVDDGLGQTVCGVGECQVTTPSCLNGLPQTCTPRAPQPELCDGLDNDCNGAVDNGNPGAGAACSTGKAGVCAAGTTACSAGGLVCNQSAQPSPEVCDGALDENCDGRVDEGCNCVNGRTQGCYAGPAGTAGVGACRAGTQTCVAGNWGSCVGAVVPSAETCDGVDNDCNGQVDDGLGTVSCGVGQCANTVPACAGGHAATCVPKAPGVEICDGLDNDCNGVVDDGNPGAGAACSTGHLGACAAGTTACVAGAVSCIQQRQPTAETCNGVDDDCDGTVDNGNPGGGVSCSTGKLGTCAAGTTACSGGAVVCNQTQQPRAETCNGLDDDCDGVVDNGNPGAGAACSTGLAGVCGAGLTACTAGAVVCNQSKQAATETCNGLDDNCNGAVDEGNPGGGAACSTGQSGVCAAGTTACTGGALACNRTQGPTAEVCNGLDDDCNGVVDDGLTCNYADSFSGPTSPWLVKEIDYCPGGWGGGTFSGGLMTVQAPNDCTVRLRSSFQVGGNFDIVVVGKAYWTGSYLNTHIKHFVGVYQAGTPPNSTMQLTGGFSNANPWFNGYIHYAIDLGTLTGQPNGVVQSFTVKISKVGNTITTYAQSGSVWNVISTFTVQNANALYFEFPDGDLTSSASGYEQFDSFSYIRTN